MMNSQFSPVATVGPEDADSIRVLEPWREVGWFFRDGESIVIERKGRHTRTRAVLL